MVMDFTLTYSTSNEEGISISYSFEFQIPFFVEFGKELLADGKKVYQKTLINSIITNIENTVYPLFKNLIKE